MDTKMKLNSPMFLNGIIIALFLCGLPMLTGCPPKIDSFSPESGGVGTEVTIKGKRFGETPAENTVKFARVTVPGADVTSASTTQLKAKVPSGVVTGLISVTTSHGTGKSNKNFIVPTRAKWTVMVYLDADNNLEPAGLDDFLEMASVGSTSAVNIVVQMDRIGGESSSYGNWTDTRRFLIRKGDTPSITPLQNMGEQNMGAPAVLEDFVNWAITNYPAEHYVLSIWNHGGGWRVLQERLIERSRGLTRDNDSNSVVARAVAWDDSNNDVLYMKEVQNALEAAKQRLENRTGTAVKIDVVGFDACLMGMVEVTYAMRNVANYVVGSEETEPGDGWPYDTILPDLIKTPSMDAQKLAEVIVTRYGAAYSSGITQAAVDVSKVANLSMKIDSFTAIANSEWAQIESARASARVYHPWGDYYWGVDLWDFADKVYNRVSSNAIEQAALELKNAVDDFVTTERHSSDMAGSHGTAIYFPASLAVFNNDPDHSGYSDGNTFMVVDFVKYHRWDNWLQDYYANIP